MKTEKELKEEIEELINIDEDILVETDDNCVSIERGTALIKSNLRSKLKTLQERNAEVKQAIIESKLHNTSDENRSYNLALKELLRKLGLGDEK